MIPATRPEKIIGIGGSSHDRPTRLPQVTWRLVAVAAGIAVLGVAMVYSLYPGQDTRLNNQLFQTATSTGPLGGVDYVLQLRFEDGISKYEGGQIMSELDGMTKWTINDDGVYEVHVRLAEASLQTLQDYEEHTRTLPGVQSAKFTALQLPIR
jgi:hypothetical protein